jgi:hypothetical protein
MHLQGLSLDFSIEISKKGFEQSDTLPSFGGPVSKVLEAQAWVKTLAFQQRSYLQ